MERSKALNVKYLRLQVRAMKGFQRASMLLTAYTGHQFYHHSFTVWRLLITQMQHRQSWSSSMANLLSTSKASLFNLQMCPASQQLVGSQWSPTLIYWCLPFCGGSFCFPWMCVQKSSANKTLVPFRLWGNLLPWWLHGTLLSSSASKLLKQTMVHIVIVCCIDQSIKYLGSNVI